jgi:hypothetical protein
MIVYIFPGEAPNINMALAADGVVLDVFGDAKVEEKVMELEKEYQVVRVDRPFEHEDCQRAIAANKMRCQLSGEDSIAWAEVELFRWQYGELPASDDIRTLDVVKAVKTMAVAVKQGEATREATAIVLVYLASLLPTLED